MIKNGDSGDKNKGLTIIEIIVVAAIIGTLIAVTLANYRDYEESNVLGNLAQDIALSVRLAQSYGINVSGPFESSYGISFNQGDEYFIYGDSDRGPVFEWDGNDASKLQTFNLGQGYTIDDVCVDGSAVCISAGSFNRLDITFDRPKPDANFRTDAGGTSYDYADIILQSPKGVTRTIRVRVTGYINVE